MERERDAIMIPTGCKQVRSNKSNKQQYNIVYTRGYWKKVLSLSVEAGKNKSVELVK